MTMTDLPLALASLTKDCPTCNGSGILHFPGEDIQCHNCGGSGGASLSQHISERDFLATVVEYAQLKGWRVAHFRPGMTSRIDKSGKPVWVTPVQADGKGFPDLVLARDGQLLFIEAKSEKGKLSKDQQKWFWELSKVAYSSPRVGGHLWRPSDWSNIETMLE